MFCVYPGSEQHLKNSVECAFLPHWAVPDRAVRVGRTVANNLDFEERLEIVAPDQKSVGRSAK